MKSINTVAITTSLRNTSDVKQHCGLCLKMRRKKRQKEMFHHCTSLPSVFIPCFTFLQHFTCLKVACGGVKLAHSELSENKLTTHTHKTAQTHRQTQAQRRRRRPCWSPLPLHQQCLLITQPSYFPMTCSRLTLTHSTLN